MISDFFFNDKPEEKFIDYCEKLSMEKKCDLKIVFHNFSNYDIHFFIKYLFKKYEGILTIPKSFEKQIYIMYRLGVNRVVFLDSRSFLPQSLEKLAKNLEGKYTFFKENELEKLPYPYDYISSIEKYFEPLPTDYEKWKNSINGSPPKEKIDKAIEKFKGKTLKDYTEVYLRNDVFMLLEVVSKFRSSCIRNYSLDPLNYVTLPSYSWDCFIRSLYSNSGFTINIPLLRDPKFVNILFNNIRGGISSVCLKPYLNSNMGSIKYFDANNLYGWAMCQKLPCSKFEKITDKKEIKNILENYEEGGDISYFVYCNIPKKKHHLTEVQLPFFPSRVDGRLSLNGCEKKNYLSHIDFISYAVKKGFYTLNDFYVKHIYRFEQKEFLKSYIDKNTELRSLSKDAADKDMFKLMNNAIYGKTIENVNKRYKKKIVNKNDLEKNTKKTRNIKFIEHMIDDIYCIELDNPPLMDKPIFIGFAILELSKLHMYKLFYDCILKYFPSAILSYMDTDSFILQLPKNFKLPTECNSFDFTKYPKGHEFYQENSKSVIGMLKDEYPTKDIEEFVALKSKSYAIKFSDGIELLKNKGFIQTNCYL